MTGVLSVLTGVFSVFSVFSVFNFLMSLVDGLGSTSSPSSLLTMFVRNSHHFSCSKMTYLLSRTMKSFPFAFLSPFLISKFSAITSHGLVMMAEKAWSGIVLLFLLGYASRSARGLEVMRNIFWVCVCVCVACVCALVCVVCVCKSFSVKNVIFER